MVEYSEGAARRAEEIAAALLERETRRLDLEDGLSIIDVEAHAAEFREDLEILSHVGIDVPSIRIGDGGPVPVSLSYLTFGGFPSQPRFYGARRWRRYPGILFEMEAEYISRAIRNGYAPIEGLETISAEVARANFLRRATDFLATRISAIRAFRGRGSGAPPPLGMNFLNILQRSGGPRITAPGCSFSVSSNSSGLRVFWSGAYYISPNYFGHPTTPTVSVLQSGAYVFGVDGGAYSTVQWDTTAICSLPGKPSVHLNF